MVILVAEIKNLDQQNFIGCLRDVTFARQKFQLLLITQIQFQILQVIQLTKAIIPLKI